MLPSLNQSRPPSLVSSRKSQCPRFSWYTGRRRSIKYRSFFCSAFMTGADAALTEFGTTIPTLPVCGRGRVCVNFIALDSKSVVTYLSSLSSQAANLFFAQRIFQLDAIAAGVGGVFHAGRLVYIARARLVNGLFQRVDEMLAARIDLQPYRAVGRLQHPVYGIDAVSHERMLAAVFDALEAIFSQDVQDRHAANEQTQATDGVRVDHDLHLLTPV